MEEAANGPVFRWVPEAKGGTLVVNVESSDPSERLVHFGTYDCLISIGA